MDTLIEFAAALVLGVSGVVYGLYAATNRPKLLTIQPWEIAPVLVGAICTTAIIYF